MVALLSNVIHVLLMLGLPPLLLGVIAKTKALFAGRVGPPLLQPYYDLIKLFRKGSVFSSTTTWVFRAGPVVGLATAVMAALMIPLVDGQRADIVHGRHDPPGLSARAGPLLHGDRRLGYRLGVRRHGRRPRSHLRLPGRAGPVPGPARAGEALGLAAVGRHAGPSLAAHWPTAGASLALVLISWFIVLLAENSRIPFDDPNTHLELTMIHEVMVLDHSGPALGMILYGAAMKLFVFGAIVFRLACPLATGSAGLGLGDFRGGMLAVAVAVGIVESIMARLRLTQIPVLLVAACLLSAFGIS